jgi:predicted PurR-regulated permease PerM
MLPESIHRTPRLVRPATTARSATARPRGIALVLVTVILLFAAALILWPFVASLVLAAWAAHLSRPLFVRLRSALGGRGRAAGLLTALLVVLAIAPLVLAIMTLIPAAKSLLEQLRAASGGKGLLEALVSESGGAPLEGRSIVALVKEYGASASRALAVVASASIEVIIGAFVFFTVFYALLVDGDRWWSWARDRAPMQSSLFDRLGGAFYQAGRGLIVGSGLTALIQGGLAAVLYAAFGVPRALLFGMLSVVAALIPMTGPMLVWVPVCAGLALTGHPAKALGLGALCAGVVGTIDNVVRPWLSRRFQVGMPAAVVLVAMLGGIVVLGGWGLFLGPLVIRLAGEMLDVCRERRIFGPYSKTP